MSNEIKEILESIYQSYHKKEYICKDPIYFPHQYNNPIDQEIVGFISAMFAFGKVSSFMKKIDLLLSRLGEKPSEAIASLNDFECEGTAKGIIHRFVNEKEVSSMLQGLRDILKTKGSLKYCFLDGFSKGMDVFEGLRTLTLPFTTYQKNKAFLIIPPKPSSPSKRLNMFLRWMVRKDDIDLGLWHEIPKSKLIMPIDVHVSRIARTLGLLPTKRSSVNWRDAVELTNKILVFEPDDPLKFDFALSHFGMENKHPLDLLNILNQ